MKRFVFYTLIFFAGLGYTANAQDSIQRKNSLSLFQGINYTVQKDLYRSPYPYSGLNPLIGLKYERYTPKSFHRLSAELVFGKTKTSFSPLAATQLLEVDYTYLRKIISGSKINFYAGPQLNGTSWSIDYFPEMNVPNYSKVRSYLLGFSLGLALNMKYTLNSKNHLALTLAAPACAYLERPKFLDGSPKQNQFGVFNYWNPKVQLSYEHTVSEKFSLLIDYQYQYLEYSKPKSIRMMNNSLSLGILRKF